MNTPLEPTTWPGLVADLTPDQFRQLAACFWVFDEDSFLRALKAVKG